MNQLPDENHKSEGLKFDNNKLQWSLLPFTALEEVVRVLEFGMKKYSKDNWMKVKPMDRYVDAAFRHLIQYANGEQNDKETDLPHLAHGVCCLLFKIWGDKNISQCHGDDYEKNEILSKKYI